MNSQLKKGDLVANILFREKKQTPAPITNNQLIFSTQPITQQITFKTKDLIMFGDYDFEYSKFGILIGKKNIIYGSFKRENIKLPLGINCWSVFCNQNKIEYWRTEDIVKIGE